MNTKISRQAQRGYTLMEMMVVVLIIGILASLIVPGLLKKADDAKIAKAKADISTLDSSIQEFRLDNGRYPTNDEGLNALESAPSNCPKWEGPYLKNSLPNDPWGNPYTYQSPGANGEDYVITSYGPSGTPGGADNITSDSTQ